MEFFVWLLSLIALFSYIVPMIAYYGLLYLNIELYRRKYKDFNNELILIVSVGVIPFFNALFLPEMYKDYVLKDAGDDS